MTGFTSINIARLPLASLMITEITSQDTNHPIFDLHSAPSASVQTADLESDEHWTDSTGKRKPLIPASEVDPKLIELVKEQAECSEEKAVMALRKWGDNLVDASESLLGILTSLLSRVSSDRLDVFGSRCLLLQSSKLSRTNLWVDVCGKDRPCNVYTLGDVITLY